MLKEFFICIIILILIFIGNGITQGYSRDSIENINKELESLKEEISKEQIDEEQVLNIEEEIYNKWQEIFSKLAYYIEHDELEKVETQIFAIKGFAEIKKYDEIVPELEKCTFILEHIQDKTKLNVKNVF